MASMLFIHIRHHTKTKSKMSKKPRNVMKSRKAFDVLRHW